MIQKPKAIAFDLDGTLAESKQRMSSEMGDILGDLMREMPVAILSGASFEQVEKQFFPALPLNANLEHLYMFPENAGKCFVYRDGTWKPQYDHSLTETESAAIVAALNQSLAEVGLNTKPSKLWGEQMENRGAQISFSPLGQEAPIDAKEAWHRDNEPLRKQLKMRLEQLLPNFSVAEGGMTTIDITHKGITKAYGLQRFAELTGIAIADMLYVGDALEEGGNDAVVIDTGIETHAVFGPEETAAFIEGLLHKMH
jgi:phosphomannomutase